MLKIKILGALRAKKLQNEKRKELAIFNQRLSTIKSLLFGGR